MPINSFRETCKQHKLKVTPQRFAIYEILQDAKNHPTADIIFKKVRGKFPHISFDTVNRTLLTFARIGIIKPVEGYGEPKRFDTNTDTHHHFRCIRCNNIIDFSDSTYDNIDAPESIKIRHTVLDKKVLLEGICHSCQ